MGYIRFLLAICVIFAHAGPVPYLGYMAGGTVAVQCFFILSGFYMALVLNQKYNSVGQFYWNRFSRIYSGYWIALIFALVLMHLRNDDLFEHIFSSSMTFGEKIFVAIANLFIFGTDLTLFTDATPHGLTFVSSFSAITTSMNPYLALPQSWSLPIELMFYLIAPFCCRSPIRLSILFIASQAVLVSLTHWLGKVDPWTARVFPVTIQYFVGGSLCYYLMPIAKNKPKSYGYFAFGLVLLGIFTFDIVPTDFRWVLFPIVAIGTPFIMCAVTGWVEQQLGEVSYMVYLIHIPVLYMLAFMRHVSLPVVVVLSIVISFALQPLAKAADHYVRHRFPLRNANLIAKRAST